MTAADLMRDVCACLVARDLPAFVQHGRLYIAGSFRAVAFVNPSAALVVLPVYASDTSDVVVHRAWNPRKSDTAQDIASAIVARIETAKAQVAA
jgi:hypothetical protein